MAQTDRETLEKWVQEFTEAFNRDDLDGVMSHFADDAVYDEFNGHRAEGKAAVRAAFEPQFRGDFGTIRFHPDDLVLDPDAGKVMISWTCTLQRDASGVSWRGLDILHLRDGKLTVKQTYAKAEKLLLTKNPPDQEPIRG